MVMLSSSAIYCYILYCAIYFTYIKNINKNLSEEGTPGPLLWTALQVDTLHMIKVNILSLNCLDTYS